MKKKINLGIIFGGRSVEHEISLLSAKNIVNAVNKKKYKVYLISIDKNGNWRLAKTIKIDKKDPLIFLVPKKNKAEIINLTTNQPIANLDVIFPALHGTDGEDGSIQGFLRLCQIPFVGSNVLGSAIGMDKEITKRLLQQVNIPVAKFIVVTKDLLNKISFKKIKNKLGLPFFVKPASLGSSVGVNKVKNIKQFKKAIKEAFHYDNKILIEECIDGREIECAVLGNEKPIASLPGEIVPTHEFYSYEAKYLDENGAFFKIPAPLPKPLSQKIQKLAIKTFKVLRAEGMARIDFFLKKNGDLLINEINTIPGFTKISMYPKLFEISGIPQKILIEKLIQLAFQRSKKENKLNRSFIN